MALNIAKEGREMQKRTVRELRKQYADVFSEATNASHPDWLIKRIAWRMQSNRPKQESASTRRNSSRMIPALTVIHTKNCSRRPNDFPDCSKREPTGTPSRKSAFRSRGHWTTRIPTESGIETSSHQIFSSTSPERSGSSILVWPESRKTPN